jgi:16S rRNA (adenine1518-N6/adenine1519-N6)-dimethyltransferase
MATLYEEVRAALRESELKPRKRLGQNFLIHQGIIDSILRLLDLQPQDEVVEIGPGLGFLTRQLLKTGVKVWAIEVDNLLADWLERNLGPHPGFQLIHGDILKIPLEEWLPERKVKLVGNLPYSISTEVLFRVFGWREHFSSLVLMVQKEVADRMASGPGKKSYGTLSVWCQLHGRITEKVSVSPEAFFPRPKVRSTVVKIELYPEPRVKGKQLQLLRELVRAAFGQRRKILGNSLSGWLNKNGDEIEMFLHSQKIDPRRRGETLTVEEFVGLARAAYELEASGAD